MCRNSELTFTISFFIYLFILKLIYVNCFYMKILIDKILYYVWNKAFEVSKKKKKKNHFVPRIISLHIANIQKSQWLAYGNH